MEEPVSRLPFRFWPWGCAVVAVIIGLAVLPWIVLLNMQTILNFVGGFFGPFHGD
ncbi:MAG TPA: hypothetical protein VGJ26_08620 [Pirellulales bacterium]